MLCAALLECLYMVVSKHSTDCDAEPQVLKMYLFPGQQALGSCKQWIALHYIDEMSSGRGTQKPAFHIKRMRIGEWINRVFLQWKIAEISPITGRSAILGWSIAFNDKLHAKQFYTNPCLIYLDGVLNVKQRHVTADLKNLQDWCQLILWEKRHRSRCSETTRLFPAKVEQADILASNSQRALEYS